MKLGIRNRILAIAIALAAFNPAVRAQSSVAGDWQGTLSAGGVELRLVFHIKATPDGALSATLDSIDQGANGIPATSATLKQGKLSVAFNSLNATYEGTVSADASTITGTWSQGTPIDLNLKRVEPAAAPKAGPPSDIDGTWAGTLDLGTAKLRILFSIVNTTAGLSAQLQSPDQSPAWIPVRSIARSGPKLTIDIKALAAEYVGAISTDLRSINGSFTQMGKTTPLMLKRVNDKP